MEILTLHGFKSLMGLCLCIHLLQFCFEFLHFILLQHLFSSWDWILDTSSEWIEMQRRSGAQWSEPSLCSLVVSLWKSSIYGNQHELCPREILVSLSSLTRWSLFFLAAELFQDKYFLLSSFVANRYWACVHWGVTGEMQRGFVC